MTEPTARTYTRPHGPYSSHELELNMTPAHTRATGASSGAFLLTAESRLAPFGAGTAKSAPQEQTVQLPAYLVENYWWAYLRPASVKLLDYTAVVSVILWGCYGRLKRAAFAELKPGQRALQAACVYGDFSPHLASLLGPAGALEIIDLAPIQVENCRGKLRGFPNTRVRIADAAAPGGGPYDIAYSFFLLHELPDEKKRNVVDALLNSIAPGGKVVFIDYHRPVSRHLLKALMGLIFDRLEPFAKTLWRSEISSFASSARFFSSSSS